MKEWARTALIPTLSLLQSCGQQPASVLDHALNYQRLGSPGGSDTITLKPLNLQGTDTIVVLGIGRGDLSGFSASELAPRPQTFLQLGEAHRYTAYPGSGTATYWLPVESRATSVAVGAGTFPRDEVTVAAVAVGGKKIADYSWTERSAGFKVQSAPVTTSGRATLIAFWWGDAGSGGRKYALPGEGFKLVEAILEEGALVQCAVAVRSVEKAGTYTASWYAYPQQGAQLWLVAVE